MNPRNAFLTIISALNEQVFSIKDYHNHIEFKRTVSDEYYFQIEKINELFVFGIYEEERREIPFDIGGFDHSQEIVSEDDLNNFIKEVLKMIELL